MVVEEQGTIAQVLMRRNRQCEGCGSCCVMVDDDNMLAEAVNRIGAKKGDRVVVELPVERSIRAAYILYGIPLLAFLIGYALGALLGSALFGGGYSVLFGIILAFGFLTLSYIIISRVYAPQSRAASRYRPVIIKVLQSYEGNKENKY